MTSLHYISLTGSITDLGESMTFTINSILIYLTVFYIRNIKGGYKILVLALANLEIVFALLEFLVQPFLHSYNSSYIYFTIDPVYGASKALKFWLLWLYSGCYSVLICLITIQFFYRYSLITGSQFKVVKLIDKWWWVYCSFWTVIWMVFYYQCVPDKDSEEYLREAMVKEYDSDIEEIPGFFIVVYNQDNSRRLNTIITIGGLSLILTFQYSIIIYCGLEIHDKLKSESLQMSPKAVKMQRQLFKTLILQILNPFIFHHTSAFILMSIIFLDLKISMPSGVVICFYSWFPSIDSLVMMYMVTEYKVVLRKRVEICIETMLQWLQKGPMEEEGETTATNFQSKHFV